MWKFFLDLDVTSQTKEGRKEVPAFYSWLLSSLFILFYFRPVDTVYNVMCLVQYGLRTRRESATMVHEHSSRSHLVVTLTVVSQAPSFFSLPRTGSTEALNVEGMLWSWLCIVCVNSEDLLMYKSKALSLDGCWLTIGPGRFPSKWNCAMVLLGSNFMYCACNFHVFLKRSHHFISLEI